MDGFTDYFRRYELLIEYKNLQNTNHCPAGISVMPLPDNLYVWHGTLFIHRGYYKGGVFKFIVNIPQTYPDGPDSAPRYVSISNSSVTFVTDMFHPLIDPKTRLFSTSQQFPIWRPHKDYICHLLHYIKNSFKEAVLMTLEDSFVKLAGQCAQLSCALDVLYDNTEFPNSSMQFSYLEDDAFEAVKAEMLKEDGRGLHAFINPDDKEKKFETEQSLTEFLSTSFNKLMSS